MADISKEIADIELAARGEEVRDSIISALRKIYSHVTGEMSFQDFDSTPTENSLHPVTSHGLYIVIQELLSQINALTARVEELESGSGGEAEEGGNAPEEGNLLTLNSAEVEDNMLILDPEGAGVSENMIELAAVTSVENHVLSLPGTSVSGNILISENGSVDGSILEL
jgi:hypothetical protein